MTTGGTNQEPMGCAFPKGDNAGVRGLLSTVPVQLLSFGFFPQKHRIASPCQSRPRHDGSRFELPAEPHESLVLKVWGKRRPCIPITLRRPTAEIGRRHLCILSTCAPETAVVPAGHNRLRRLPSSAA